MGENDRPSHLVVLCKYLCVLTRKNLVVEDSVLLSGLLFGLLAANPGSGGNFDGSVNGAHQPHAHTGHPHGPPPPPSVPPPSIFVCVCANVSLAYFAGSRIRRAVPLWTPLGVKTTYMTGACRFRMALGYPLNPQETQNTAPTVVPLPD